MQNQQYHATPYNLEETGFYFSTYEEYLQKSAENKDCFGVIIEEYFFHIIDGDNCQLFNALEVDQGSLQLWFESYECLDGDNLIRAIYLSEHLNVKMSDIIDQIEDVVLFEGHAKAYVEEFAEETGLLNDLPEQLQYYFDFDAYARDLLLGGEISEIEIMGVTYVTWS
ncbi:MAG: antirestriction protein ArdA [Aliivibrio sp.]|uniref:antirestriction protein ArdA n=1 Tax=Aliivibrio sp. TaxID=1872443 RepID=UPI001A59399C|nr:antirestriction protein ArdA [Aliivibrio sp.]